MARYEHSVVIERPIEEVWAFVTDPANNAMWQTTIVETRTGSNRPLDVGSKVAEVRQFLGRRVESTWEVTQHEPPTRSAIKTSSGPVPFTGRYALDSIDGGTRFTMAVEAEAHGFFRLAEPVFGRIVKREMKANCGHLKDLLEAAV